ncbi:hypothetical protein [Halostella sp. PRR32]|uniref:hypothetical protein n=1 Tax=Halostella sp. PRR32 TaxID=3098147 RepID=UPI00110E78AF|nr:hypothetical protein [Halostella sp. PRR32]
MATFESYVIAALTWAVWMICYAILSEIFRVMLPIAEDLGGNTVGEPIGWLWSIIDHWALIGLIGVFISMLAVGILENRRPLT